MAHRIHVRNKDTGVTYVYEGISYWDKEKKQPRNKRVCIGSTRSQSSNTIPAIYSLASPSGITGLKKILMKSHEIKAIVNGLIAQLTTNVTRRGLEFFFTFIISLNSIFSMIGFIMKSRTTATGIEALAICQFPREFDRPGRMLPSMTPRNIATPPTL